MYTIENLNITYNKYSTIYAPHKILNMMSDEFSFNYCSLIECKTRPAITCWINIDTSEIQFERHFVIVKKNLNYDEADAYMYNFDDSRINKTLIKLLEYSIELNDKYKFVECITSTHEMVQIYMVFLNMYIATMLKDKHIIYRNQLLNKPAEYSYENNKHVSMNVDYYTHFTSPIRRAVDQYIHQILINEYFTNKDTKPIAAYKPTGKIVYNDILESLKN
jgi:exoribonuclease R